MKRLITFLIIPSLAFASIHPIPHYDYEPLLPCACRPLLQLKTEPITEENLATFAEYAATNLYSYGFGNYHAALKIASHFFTPAGWEKMQTALEASQNIEEVVENKMLVSATVLQRASKIEAFSENTWLYQLVLQVNYSKEGGSFNQKLHVRVLLKKYKKGKQMDAIGIESFQAEAI